MNKEIQVTRKCRCGSEYIYPFCENAKLFCEMTNRKTFSKEMLVLIKKLGFDIVELVEGE